jgi:hypothetical protein
LLHHNVVPGALPHPPSPWVIAGLPSTARKD